MKVCNVTFLFNEIYLLELEVYHFLKNENKNATCIQQTNENCSESKFYVN